MPFIYLINTKMIYINPKMTLVYFGVDCRPWNTTLFAVPWQLNHFHIMLIINFS